MCSTKAIMYLCTCISKFRSHSCTNKPLYQFPRLDIWKWFRYNHIQLVLVGAVMENTPTHICMYRHTTGKRRNNNQSQKRNQHLTNNIHVTNHVRIKIYTYSVMPLLLFIILYYSSLIAVAREMPRVCWLSEKWFQLLVALADLPHLPNPTSAVVGRDNSVHGGT